MKSLTVYASKTKQLNSTVFMKFNKSRWKKWKIIRDYGDVIKKIFMWNCARCNFFERDVFYFIILLPVQCLFNFIFFFLVWKYGLSGWLFKVFCLEIVVKKNMICMYLLFKWTIKFLFEKKNSFVWKLYVSI